MLPFSITAFWSLKKKYRKEFSISVKNSHPFLEECLTSPLRKSPPAGNANVATLNEQDIKLYRKVYLNIQYCIQIPEGNTPKCQQRRLGVVIIEAN